MNVRQGVDSLATLTSVAVFFPMSRDCFEGSAVIEYATKTSR
jgi:hypothetical protein